MNKIVNKTHIFLLVTLGFVGAGALALVGLVYLIEVNATKLQQKADNLSYYKAQQEERYETEQLLKDTEEERALLTKYMLDESSVIDFITDIESTARSLGLGFSTQAITPKETKDPVFDELSMSFDFGGPQASVAYMIAIFETLPHFSYIKDISVRQNEDTNEWSVTMNLVVTILEHD